MPNELLEGDALIDRLASGLSRASATQFPRRSFFGKVGRYAIAAAVGGSALLWQDSALANSCTHSCSNFGHCWDSACACSHESADCGCLGYGNCPSGTCQCGCWLACDGTCGTFATQWCDCCHTTTSPSSSCVSG